MKNFIKIFLAACLLTVFAFGVNAQSVGINADGSAPNSSAGLDINFTNKGFLPPRMTMAQRDAIISPAPATGLLIYQTDNTPGYYYYNGTAWAALAGSGGSGFSHYIGELYGGGIVVAVWKVAGVEKGLIASLENMQTSVASYMMAWSGNTGTLIGATAQSPIDGQANTTAIIGQIGSTTNKAATVCDAYSNTETGTGVYSDWYLPAVWELNQCFNAAFVVNTILGATNGFKLAGYWSSTEFNGTLALNYDFHSGYESTNAKYSTVWVRAVRAF